MSTGSGSRQAAEKKTLIGASTRARIVVKLISKSGIHSNQNPFD
jgi:hypothetical protein